MAKLTRAIGAFFNGVSESRAEVKEQKIIQKDNNYEFEKARIERGISDAKVNHILHFLLCFPTVGVWIIPWILISNSTAHKRIDLKKELEELYTNHKRLESQQKPQINESNYLDKLEQLASLRDKNAITDEEFQIEKAKIMSNK